MENCCENLIRYILIIINFIYTLVGLALIIIGVVFQQKAGEYLKFVGDDFNGTPTFFIILGVVIFVVAFFGCCGAKLESKCMVYTYASICLIIIIAQIGGGIACFIMKGKLKEEVPEKMTDLMKNYGGDEGVTKAWDLMQENLQCCGTFKPVDWDNKNKTIPDSCYEENDKSKKRFEEGCWPKLEELVLNNVNLVGGIVIGIAFAQVIGVVTAYCIAKKME